MDEGIATLKRGNLTLVIVDADDIVPHLCETDSSHQTDVSRTDNGDWNGFSHTIGCSLSALRISDLRGFRDNGTKSYINSSRNLSCRLNVMGPQNAQTPSTMAVSRTTPPAFSTTVTDTTLSETLITLRKRMELLIVFVLLA